MGHVRENCGRKSGRNTTKDERFHINGDMALGDSAERFLNDNIAKEKHEKEAEKAEISERFEFFSQT